MSMLQFCTGGAGEGAGGGDWQSHFAIPHTPPAIASHQQCAIWGSGQSIWAELGPKIPHQIPLWLARTTGPRLLALEMPLVVNAADAGVAPLLDGAGFIGRLGPTTRAATLMALGL